MLAQSSDWKLHSSAAGTTTELARDRILSKSGPVLAPARMRLKTGTERQANVLGRHSRVGRQKFSRLNRRRAGQLLRLPSASVPKLIGFGD